MDKVFKIAILSIFIFSLKPPYAQSSFYKQDCPSNDVACLPPSSLMSNPNNSTPSFEEGFECHINRFLFEDTRRPQTKYNFCGDPYYMQSIQNLDSYLQEDHLQDMAIDPICFYAGSLRGKNSLSKSSNFYSCEDYSSPNPTRGHSKKGACLSQEYSEKFALLFEQMTNCFSLSQKEKNNFFKILNNESAFMPNARSDSGARCLGQLTQDAFKDISINMTLRINYPDDTNYALYKDYDLANGKCAYLDNYTIPPNIRENVIKSVYNNINPEHDTVKNTYTQFLGINQEDQQNFWYECKILSNPVQCLLYSTLYYKLSLNQFDHAFIPKERRSRTNSLNTASNEERNKFQEHINEHSIGLSPNEIYVFKDEENSSNPMVFVSTGGAYEKFIQDDFSPTASIKKVSLLSPEDFARMKDLALQLSYNAGQSITRNKVEYLLNVIKDRIANPNNPDYKYRKYRQMILEGKTLPFEFIEKSFIEAAIQLNDDRGSTRKTEIREYASKVKENMDYVLGKDEESSLKTHFKKYLGTDDENLAHEFMKEVQNKCSSISNDSVMETST